MRTGPFLPAGMQITSHPSAWAHHNQVLLFEASKILSKQLMLKHQQELQEVGLEGGKERAAA